MSYIFIWYVYFMYICRLWVWACGEPTAHCRMELGPLLRCLCMGRVQLGHSTYVRGSESAGAFTWLPDSGLPWSVVLAQFSHFLMWKRYVVDRFVFVFIHLFRVCKKHIFLCIKSFLLLKIPWVYMAHVSSYLSIYVRLFQQFWRYESQTVKYHYIYLN